MIALLAIAFWIAIFTVVMGAPTLRGRTNYRLAFAFNVVLFGGILLWVAIFSH